jgi:hypothetical protein
MSAVYRAWRQSSHVQELAQIGAAAVGELYNRRQSIRRAYLPSGQHHNFSPDGPMVLRENTPQGATTRKRAIRIAMERRLEAARAEGLRSLNLRAGDFVGPYLTGNRFSQLVKPGRPVRSITYAGPPEIGHSSAYCPTSARPWRNSRRATQAFQTLRCFISEDTGSSEAEAIRAVLADPSLPIRSMPWWLVGSASPFVPLMRELWEMRYLWHVLMRLDNSKLLAILGEEPMRPKD